MDKETAVIKQQWFVEMLQKYLERTDDMSAEEKAYNDNFYTDKLKDSFCIISVTVPISGEDPYVIIIADNNGTEYDSENGRVVIKSKRVTTLTCNGADISISHEHDIRDGSTVFDWDITQLKSCDKSRSALIYKMFKSIEQNLNTGLDWILS